MDLKHPVTKRIIIIGVVMMIMFALFVGVVGTIGVVWFISGDNGYRFLDTYVTDGGKGYEYDRTNK